MGLVAVREMARHRIRQSAYVGLTRQQLDDIMHERERQRDRREAAMVAADRSVEIAQSYVVPAFERGARVRRCGGGRFVRMCASEWPCGGCLFRL